VDGGRRADRMAMTRLTDERVKCRWEEGGMEGGEDGEGLEGATYPSLVCRGEASWCFKSCLPF